MEATNGVPALSRFYKLPRELRDIIYDLLWTKSRRMEGECALGAICAFYRPGQPNQFSKDASQALPQWLVTSKQILQEGLDQFRRNSTWHVVDVLCLSKPIIYMPPLMHPRNAQALVVWLPPIYEDYNPAGLPHGMRRKWELEPRITRALHHLWTSISVDDTVHLKKLWVRTRLAYREWKNVHRTYVLYRAHKEDKYDRKVHLNHGWWRSFGDADGDKDDGCPYNSANHSPEVFDFSGLEPPDRFCRALSTFSLEFKELESRPCQPGSAAIVRIATEVKRLGERLLGTDVEMNEFIYEMDSLWREKGSVRSFVFKRATGHVDH
ncbi:hypothetical protein P171DRAFT_91265 [Karstenula rhodostoma CBS 690.94]|uniref:Uncharacterized protein n=1 Tax=Karstenula rhodostoma CBS 690.94 TaxID=1392251 RepID=A0A9P4PA18_9PLEO|nr:hypothetical protein P171DRAFT_91265 [Karstenula rhodostoma CBS 690.94]